VKVGRALTFQVSGTDPDSATLTYSAGSLPAGAVFNGTTRTFTWTPASTQVGTFVVSFTVSDGALSDSKTVSITVIAANLPPIADSQSVTTDEDSQVAIRLTATDPEGRPLSYTIVHRPDHGFLFGFPPNLFYVPARNYYGEDSFTFRANDGTSASNTATVTITVNPVNDAPVARDATVTTKVNTSVSGKVTATDVDSTTLTYRVMAQPGHGTLTFNPNGSFTYKPAVNFRGSDSFTFRANDGAADSNTAQVKIQVK
jgi:VCBS repeat-containing protein